MDSVDRFISQQERTRLENQVVTELIAGRPFWFGELGADWKFCVLGDKHALTSVFLAHPLHPFSKGERVIAMLSSLSFSLFVASVLNVSGLDGAERSIVSVVLGVCTSLFLMLLKFCMMCSSAQSLPGVIRCCLECLGRGVVAFAMIFVVFPVLGVGLALAVLYVENVCRFCNLLRPR